MHVAKMHDKVPLFGRYRLVAYDELFEGPSRARRVRALYERLIKLGPDELERRQQGRRPHHAQQGITFTVYGRDQGVERIIPFDPIPRLIAQVSGIASSAG